jgi:hypothetical protein
MSLIFLILHIIFSYKLLKNFDKIATAIAENSEAVRQIKKLVPWYLRWIITEKNLKKGIPAFKKKFKQDIIKIGISLAILAIIEIVIWMVVISIMTGYTQILNNVAGLMALGFYDEPVYDEEGNLIEEGGWYWDIIIDDEDDGGGGGVDPDPDPDPGTGEWEKETPGIWPSDSKWKIRSQLMAIAEACAEAASTPDFTIKPAWIMGVSLRESGGGDLRFIGKNNPDLFNDLCMTDSYCGRIHAGSYCPWDGNLGTSVHIVGGGDPRKNQFINGSNASAPRGHTLNHAVGPYQFEMEYLYKGPDGTGRYVYLSKVSTTQTQHKYDAELDMLRPNVLYVPDALWSTTMQHVYVYETIVKNKPFMKSNDFKNLSKSQQDAIKFAMAGYCYGIPAWDSASYPSHTALANALIAAAKRGKNIEHLVDEAFEWNSGNLMVQGKNGQGWSAYVNSADRQLALSFGKHFPYIGLAAMSGGNLQYDMFKTSLGRKRVGGGSSGEGFGWPTDPIIPIYRGYKSYKYTSGKNADGTARLVWHGGVDISGGAGSEIQSVLDGTVTLVNSTLCTHTFHFGADDKLLYPCYGLQVVVDHGIVNGQRLFTRYAHLASTSVTRGDKVTKGQKLGILGNTGASTGAHLHFEVYTDTGTRLDPCKYLGHKCTIAAGCYSKIAG